jgi:hypothetical protein
MGVAVQPCSGGLDWSQDDLDMLPLNHTATDWLLGVWGALVWTHREAAIKHST